MSSPRVRTTPLLPRLRATYLKVSSALQDRLRSGRLTEEQRLRVFFFIASEELKTMTPADLRKAKRKHEALLAAAEKTVVALTAKQRQMRIKDTRFFPKARSRLLTTMRARLSRRIMLERLVVQESKRFLRRIENESSRR